MPGGPGNPDALSPLLLVAASPRQKGVTPLTSAQHCTKLVVQEHRGMTAPISIDANDRTPIYAQLERGIRVAIATGRLRPGDQLPTVRQFAVDLRVNANTVAKVYVTLEREGVLVTRRGVGTFIADSVPKSAHTGQ